MAGFGWLQLGKTFLATWQQLFVHNPVAHSDTFYRPNELGFSKLKSCSKSATLRRGIGAEVWVRGANQPGHGGGGRERVERNIRHPLGIAVLKLAVTIGRNGF